MNNEIKDDPIINHVRNVKLLQAIHEGKDFYVKCAPDDPQSLKITNGFFLKQIELPNFNLFEEKLGYRWVKVPEKDAGEAIVIPVPILDDLITKLEWAMDTNIPFQTSKTMLVSMLEDLKALKRVEPTKI